MNKAILWKEYRQQRSIWLAIVFLGVLLSIAIGEALAAGGLRHAAQDPNTRETLLMLLFALGIGHGVVSGAMLLAGDKDDGTLVFLDMHTGLRGPLWYAKFIAGVLLTTSLAAALAALLVALGLGKSQLGKSQTGVLLFGFEVDALLSDFAHSGLLMLSLTFDALLAGLLGGALCPSVLTAVFIGIGYVAATWVVILVLPGPLPLVGKLLFDAVAVFASYRKYCESDHSRRARGRETAGAEDVFARLLPRFLRARLQAGWKLAWLFQRQGRWLIRAGVLLAVLAGLTLHQAPILIWPIASLLIGLGSGLATWAPEQTGGQAGFLGSLRMPPGRFWLAKMAFWSAVAGALLVAMAGIGLSMMKLQQAETFRDDSWLTLWIRQRGIYWNVTIAALVWPLYGFAVGQFWALALRRTVLAVIVASATAALVLGLWTPTLFFGGLDWLAMLVPLLVLLAATRLTLWAWFGRRLASREPIVVLVAGPVACVLWQGAVLAHRALEIPEVGEPFDVQAYRDKLQTLDREKAGFLVRQAGRELAERKKMVEAGLGPPTEPLFEDEADPRPANAALRYDDWIDDVLNKGWPRRDQELKIYLDQIFAGTWIRDLDGLSAQPLGLVINPLHLTANSRLPEIDDCQRLTRFLRLRALRLQHEKKFADALRDLELVLALSRQQANHAINFGYASAIGIEYQGLIGVDAWRKNLGSDAALLKKCGDVLARHAVGFPGIAESIKADYLLYRGEDFRVADLPTTPRWLEAVYVPLARAPWERARHDRLVRTIFRAEVDNAAAPFSQMNLTNANRLENLDYDRLPAERWGEIIDAEMMREVAGMVWWGTFRRAADREARAKAMLLTTALATYQAEKQTLPQKLEELVPAYLAALPINPFTGDNFEYRVSAGEKVHGYSLGSEESTFVCAAGRGYVSYQEGGRRWYFPVP